MNTGTTTPQADTLTLLKNRFGLRASASDAQLFHEVNVLLSGREEELLARFPAGGRDSLRRLLQAPETHAAALTILTRTKN